MVLSSASKCFLSCKHRISESMTSSGLLLILGFSVTHRGRRGAATLAAALVWLHCDIEAAVESVISAEGSRAYRGNLPSSLLIRICIADLLYSWKRHIGHKYSASRHPATIALEQWLNPLCNQQPGTSSHMFVLASTVNTREQQTGAQDRLSCRRFDYK